MFGVATIPIYTRERSFSGGVVVYARGGQGAGLEPRSSPPGCARLQELEPIGCGPFFIERHPLAPSGRQGSRAWLGVQSNSGCTSGPQRAEPAGHTSRSVHRGAPAVVCAVLQIGGKEKGRLPAGDDGPSAAFYASAAANFIHRALKAHLRRSAGVAPGLSESGLHAPEPENVPTIAWP